MKQTKCKCNFTSANYLCKRHSPSVTDRNNQSKGQEGEVNKEKSKDSSSSFLKDLSELILIYNTDMTADEFKRRLIRLVERDYVTKKENDE